MKYKTLIEGLLEDFEDNQDVKILGAKGPVILDLKKGKITFNISGGALGNYKWVGKGEFTITGVKEQLIKYLLVHSEDRKSDTDNMVKQRMCTRKLVKEILQDIQEDEGCEQKFRERDLKLQEKLKLLPPIQSSTWTLDKFSIPITIEKRKEGNKLWHVIITLNGKGFTANKHSIPDFDPKEVLMELQYFLYEHKNSKLLGIDANALFEEVERFTEFTQLSPYNKWAIFLQ